MPHKITTFLLLSALLAACGKNDGSDRALAYAKTHLGAGDLRIAEQTELTTDTTAFFRVEEGKRALEIVVPAHGEIFDATTPNAFSRVTQAEHAVDRIAQLSADRVVLWFLALGGQCPPVPTDNLHFATTTPTQDGGLTITYVGPPDELQSCIIDLAPDGKLREAHLQPLPPARADSKWPEHH